MTITTDPRSTRWRIAALTAICLLALSVSACGSFGGFGGDGGNSTTSEGEAEDAWLKVARCFREQGVPADVPEDGGLSLDTDAKNFDRDALEKAQKACKDLIEAAEPKEAGEPLSAEDKQRMLAEAQCIRERGWDQPDPEFLGGSRIKWETPPNVDLNDPKLQKDMEECQEEAGEGEEE